MLAGSVIIVGDLIGTLQEEKDGKYTMACSDGKIRTVTGKATVVAKPHALALLYYTKLLESMGNKHG